MRNITIEFNSFLELIDFTLVVDHSFFEANGNFLTGKLAEADIELAKSGYRATIILKHDEFAEA